MFPGQYSDQETGLHYNYFRYYDPATGRYLTADPLTIQALRDSARGAQISLEPTVEDLDSESNRNSIVQDFIVNPHNLQTYAYAFSNPLRFTDRTGLNPGVARLAYAATLAAAKAAKKQIEKAANTCKNIRCKLEDHGPHHYFGWPFNERLRHIQLTCWIKGRKGSTWILRFPYYSSDSFGGP